MNRGIVKLTNAEATELLKNINIDNYAETPLYNKLKSIDLNNSVIEILLSGDEIEKILDEIGIPDQQTNPMLFDAINNMNQLLLTFQSQAY